MKRLVYGIVLMFLMALSILVFDGRVMETRQYVAGASTGNAVVNGDFETDDFTGWTVNGACSISNTTVHSGSYAAYVSSATYDNSISQTFFPSELSVDSGLTLDGWIYPTKVGELDGTYPSASLVLRFKDNVTGQSAFDIYYSWCWNNYVPNSNGTSSVWFTLPSWSAGQWNELQRNVMADIYSYFNGTSFSSIFLDSTWIYYHFSSASPGAFWVDDVWINSIPLVPPAIISISRTPSVPTYESNVTVTAKVFDADQCILSYTIDGVSWINVSMSGAGRVFNVTIPVQAYNTTVQYEVYAYNSTIESWVESSTYSYTVTNTTGTIYIRAGGRIDQSLTSIYSADNITYTLIRNIISISSGIVIERDNIVLDGAGYTIQGPNITGEINGIYLNRRNNITIKNVNVNAFGFAGILAYFSSNISVVGSNMTDNSLWYLPHSFFILQCNRKQHNTQREWILSVRFS